MVGQAPAGLTHDLDDLYMRAIGQLGSKKAPVRLGALHALSRLGQNNPSLRETVIKVICAYLRMPYMPPDGESGTDRADRLNPREELQVRLTAQSILAEHLRDATHGRRNDTSVPETFWPEIDVIDLSGASLVRLDLSDCRVRAIECNNAIFNGESLFRGLICDLAFFQKAVFKGHTDFRGADFINSAWFSYSTFAADVWFHGDEFFPAARFGRHASFKHVTFARKVLFKKAVFEGSADFEGITCEEGTKAMNMRGCQVYRPEAVSPDVSKEPSIWPLGWDIVVGQNIIATLQDRTLPAVSELLRKLTVAADAQEFEFILQDILSLQARSDTADRIKARSEVSKSMWYDVIYKKFGDTFSLDTLSMIFQVIVIPDLGDSAVAKEIADWAGHAQPAVIGGLLAAARTSGDATWQLMLSLLEPSLARRWATDAGIASP